MIEKKPNKLLSSRLRILFIIVILLFSILIIRLGKIKLSKGKNIERRVKKLQKMSILGIHPVGKSMIVTEMC
ncbi:cell division protein FtsI/penicillin-binding protein 2 [Neobacillus niacini]|nr:cell division protein FtsI/penicillin-binding protein 2 [Neobacillus niacini]